MPKVAVSTDGIDRQTMAGEASRESEELYRQLVELCPDAIVVHTEGRVAYTNPAGARLFGVADPEALFDKPMLDLIHPEDREFVRARIRAIDLEGKTTPLQEYRAIRFDGGIVDIEATGAPVTYQGKPANLVIIRDISARKRAERELKALNERLRIGQMHRKRLSKRLIELCEQDRREVAMELHDRIGQALTTLKMDLEMLSSRIKSAEAPLHYEIGCAVRKTTQVIYDLKKIAYGLMPSMIKILGLIPSLRALLNEMRARTGIEIQFFSQGLSERFDQEKELAIYRIAQEALNNVLKHARAKRVFVTLMKKNGAISLSVEDDGVGFDPEEKLSISGTGGPLGLHIMKERAVQLGGDILIDSRARGGTHVLAEIPL